LQRRVRSFVWVGLPVIAIAGLFFGLRDGGAAWDAHHGVGTKGSFAALDSGAPYGVFPADGGAEYVAYTIFLSAGSAAAIAWILFLVSRFRRRRNAQASSAVPGLTEPSTP
jgi:hypothetical protein